MAKGRRGPIKRGTMHSALRGKGNQMRAGAARMQSEGKLWGKDKHGARKSTAGTEKPRKFYTVVDKMRAGERRKGKSTTMSLKAWMSRSTKGIRTKASATRRKRAK